MIELSEVKIDCRHFRGDVPCKPNKEHGAVCDSCAYYDPTDRNILMIKLGAAGDVIRTTPLLYPIKEEYPYAKIFWLTYSPELVPTEGKYKADVLMKFDHKSLAYLSACEFDMLINLDKDKEAIALAKSIKAERKIGYTMKNNVCYPVSKNSEHKFLTGIFDSYSIQNRKNYLYEIFEICGYEFKGEKYILPLDKKHDKNWELNPDKISIGLNTGAGERWTSRLWDEKNWIELINMLENEGLDVVLLGGPAEHARNESLAGATNAKYFGTHDLRTFINLMDKLPVIITGVTMGMHITLGLGKRIVLMNNIFNRYEFELYGLGEIIEPRKECKCYFRPTCVNPEYTCMEHMYPQDIFDACMRQLREADVKV